MLLAMFSSQALAAPNYEARKQRYHERQQSLAETWSHKKLTSADVDLLANELAGNLKTLASYWVGSSWGRGIPQSNTPQVGKVNCGTYVGTLLGDIGFVVNIKKLQRQPSQGIIRSFVRGKRVRKFSRSTMKDFLASVKEMGPGLFIIGMDLHVGVLIQTDSELLYTHASSETGKVVIERAADAWTIQSSNYRVVGKILSPAVLRKWLRGKRIEVKGKF